MTRTLLLLDVDGVLIHPVAYKAALGDVVSHFAIRMGQPPYGPTFDEIAVFEACGLTNEWDSTPVCVAAMLVAALEQAPHLAHNTLDATLDAIRTAQINIPRPDYTAETRAIQNAPDHNGSLPSLTYLALLTERVPPGWLPLLRELLGDIYSINTPTTRLFQTLTLGSETFAQVYEEPAPFESDSFLLNRDQALLSINNRDRLVAENQAGGATIYTARPSLPPADVSGAATTDYSPEAELAVRQLGLEGHLPLIGQGRMRWIAAQNGRSGPDYVKPAPVQALAAIAAAASGQESVALQAAAALYEHGTLSGPLAELAGEPVRVVVFEDSSGGIRATRGAVALLQDAGLSATCYGVGISPHEGKRAALEAVADIIVDDVNAGLEMVWSQA